MKKGVWFLAFVTVFIIGFAVLSVSADTLDLEYSINSSCTRDTGVSLKFDNSYKMQTSSRFTKGGVFSADSAQSTLTFVGDGSYTNASRTVKWVGTNGTTKEGNYNNSNISTYPTTTVNGELWVATLNTYHKYSGKAVSGGPSTVSYLNYNGK